MPVVLPITSGDNFARTAGFAVPLAGAGTQTTGVVRCDQPCALDLGARGGKKLERVPDAIMDEVLAGGDFRMSGGTRERREVVKIRRGIASAGVFS